jgi:hypothetical protein
MMRSQRWLWVVAVIAVGAALWIVWESIGHGVAGN